MKVFLKVKVIRMKKYNNDLLLQGKKILNQIKANDFEAYFVGGCVRDFILSLPIKDIDITTNATPDELNQIFPKLIPIGIDYGTVLVRQNNMSFEITTYRSECSHTSHAKKICIPSLEEDVSHRDFTMNALAMDCDMHIIDHHGGLKDIQAQVIRAVDCPLKRMEEDPLRILRAVRFISQFGFNVDEQTNEAIKNTAHLLESVAVERLLVEVEKIFTYSHSNKAINQFIHLQIAHYLPIFKEEPNLLLHVSQTMRPFASFAEIIAIMHTIQPYHSLSKWCQAWKCSNHDKKIAKKLVQSFIDVDQVGILDAYFIYMLKDELEAFYHMYTVLRPEEVIRLDMLYTIKNTLPIHKRNDLRINGSDIVQLFPNRQPGKWIETLLGKLEYRVVMQELPNETMTLKEWIICNPPEIN